MNTELAISPCPFCGSPKYRVQYSEDYYAYVLCGNCGANGPSVHTPECQDSHRFEAIKLWNERVNLSQPAQLQPTKLN